MTRIGGQRPNTNLKPQTDKAKGKSKDGEGSALLKDAASFGEASRNTSQVSLTKAREKLAHKFGKVIAEPSQLPRKPMLPHEPLQAVEIPLEPLKSRHGSVTPEESSPLILGHQAPGHELTGVGGRVYPGSIHGRNPA